MLGSPRSIPGEALGLGAAQCGAPSAAPAIPGQLIFAGMSSRFGAGTKRDSGVTKRVNRLVPVLRLPMVFMEKLHGVFQGMLCQTSGSWQSLGCLGPAARGEKRSHELAMVYCFLFLFRIGAFCLLFPQTTAARTRQEPTALWPSKSTCAATGTTAKPAAAPAARPTPSARQHPAPAAHAGPAPRGASLRTGSLYHLVSATHPPGRR